MGYTMICVGEPTDFWLLTIVRHVYKTHKMIPYPQSGKKGNKSLAIPRYIGLSENGMPPGPLDCSHTSCSDLYIGKLVENPPFAHAKPTNVIPPPKCESSKNRQYLFFHCGMTISHFLCILIYPQMAGLAMTIRRLAMEHGQCF